MAVCKTCGAQLSEAAKFCTGCGTKVGASNTSADQASSDIRNQEGNESRPRNRERLMLYIGIALAILIIGALLTPYPAALLDNYRHVRTDLPDDDEAANAALASCAIRNDNLRPMNASNSSLSAFGAAAAARAAIINGEPRKDYYFDEEFATARSNGSALVYNTPSAERGLLLYECSAGTELKGRWVRGGIDGSERWLRLTASRYIRDHDLAVGLAGPDGDPKRAHAAADAARDAANSEVAARIEPDRQRVSSTFIITTDGMMGIRAGQSFERAYKLFNPNGKYDVGDVDDLHACNIYRSRNGQISALVERGIITSVATDDVRFRTISNVGPGSSENELKSAYGNRLKRQPGEYDGTEYFLYSDSGNGIKFYVERGKVLGVTAGGGSIRYVEGCL